MTLGLLAFACARLDDYEAGIWKDLAYAARYGKQQLSELLRMSRWDIRKFSAAVSKIVSEENQPRGREQ